MRRRGGRPRMGTRIRESTRARGRAVTAEGAHPYAGGGEPSTNGDTNARIRALGGHSRIREDSWTAGAAGCDIMNVKIDNPEVQL